MNVTPNRRDMFRLAVGVKFCMIEIPESVIANPVTRQDCIDNVIWSLSKFNPEELEKVIALYAPHSTHNGVKIEKNEM